MISIKARGVRDPSKLFRSVWEEFDKTLFRRFDRMPEAYRIDYLKRLSGLAAALKEEDRATLKLFMEGVRTEKVLSDMEVILGTITPDEELTRMYEHGSATRSVPPTNIHRTLEPLYRRRIQRAIDKTLQRLRKLGESSTRDL